MNLNLFNNTSPQLMSSREIAQLTGKNHQHVLRDCEKLNENYERLGLSKIGQSYYHNSQGRQFREMLLNKMQTMDLMTGYNLELRIKVNRRWEQLEIKSNILPQTKKEWIVFSLKQEEEIEKLQIENSSMKPKAIIADALKVSDTVVKMSDVANQLYKNGFKLGSVRLYDYLRDKGLIQQRSTSPTQKALNLQLFEVQIKMVQFKDKLEPRPTTKVTGKGQIYIIDKFITGKWILENSVLTSK